MLSTVSPRQKGLYKDIIFTRMYSIWDEIVAPERRGKYLAFTEQSSAGVQHLRQLKEAGLSHVHLLPSYDYGSVPERVEEQAVIKASCHVCQIASVSRVCEVVSRV